MAQVIAKQTGQSLTSVVIDCLKERCAKLERENGKASVEELLSIARRAQAQLQGPYEDHASLLYDENTKARASRNKFVLLSEAVRI